MKVSLVTLMLSLLLFAACTTASPDSAPQPQAPATAVESAQITPQTSETLDNGEADNASFREADCPLDISDAFAVECGYLTVPENRTVADSPPIDLAVAILRAPAPDPQPDPIIYLAGGPGGSALSDLEGEPEVWASYTFSQERDLIFIDQRGTGYSTPTLDCVEMDEAGDDEFPEAACRERLLAEGIDLTAYNTTENAADVVALVDTLGYDEWNLLGISYGTRLALAIMRAQPPGLRSVLLDSPFPPNAATPETESLHTLAALRTLFENCAADPDCGAAFPDLEAVFLETVTALNEDPDAEIYGDDLVYLLEEALTAGADYIYLLPLLIYDVAEGNFELYDELAAELQGEAGFAKFQDGVDRTDSEGMYHSVICRDEFAFGDYDEAERLALAEIPVELQEALFSTTAQIFEVCDIWGAGQADPIENEAVVSDLPTLILVGEYDPATPPAWGRLTAETLSQAYYFEFPGAGHSLLSSEDCAIELADDFFADPTVEPDRSCLEALGELEFEIE